MVKSSKNDLDFLEDMLVYARQALETAQAIELSWEKFEDNHVYQNAIIRCVEVIGEASNKIGFDIKKALSEVAWDEMYGMRNILIHDYDEVDLQKVWQTVTVDIPSLIGILETFLQTENTPV